MKPDVVAQAKAKARAYFKAKGTLVPAATIHERLSDAFGALDAFLEPIPAAAAARAPLPGEWSVQEVVDHLIETHRPGLDELWCLLAGRRPPGGAIPASLQSKAPLLRPWPWLREELARVHAEILRTLAAAPSDFVTDARAPLVMVVNVTDERGHIVPLQWVEELDWKAYAITWRLHVIDHLKQAKNVHAALER
jgi:DinB family protein